MNKEHYYFNWEWPDGKRQASFFKKKKKLDSLSSGPFEKYSVIKLIFIYNARGHGVKFEI